MIKYLLLFIFLFSCSKQESEITSYPFKGVIIDIYNDKSQMMIKHDEVPGFMMEMTMMFNIDSSISLNEFEIGDSLNFTFNILDRKNAFQADLIRSLLFVIATAGLLFGFVGSSPYGCMRRG